MDKDSILLGKITPSHLAMAKGWVNGLPLVEMADRYLAAFGEVDLRVAKSTLMRVLQELANAATRNDIEGAAMLFRQASRIKADPSGPRPEDSPSPSYKEFLASIPDAEEFSEAEMLALYEERYPTRDDAFKKSIARQSRLIDRQLKLLARLEPLITEPMKWHDKLEGWFTPTLVERLVGAGFDSILELAVAMAAKPDDWYAGIPGIGESKANRISAFMRHSLGDIEHELSRRRIPFLMVEQVNPVRERYGVIDLEELKAISSPPSSRLLSSEDLDGSHGRLRNRLSASAIEADNDYEAMKLWLALKKSSVTVRLYEREVTRLIAWSIHVRRKPMSSLSMEDALAYRDFMLKPPADFIVHKGPRKRPNRSETAIETGRAQSVGLFTQTSLKASTVKKALVIISGFYSWLVKAGYVTANPFAGVQVASGLTGVGMGSTDSEDKAGLERARERRGSVLNRVLPLEAVDAIDRYLDKVPEEKDRAFHARARFIFKFASMTGLRISEMAAARRDAMVYVEPDPKNGVQGGWILHVLGKRDKHREVPLPHALIVELLAYMTHRGLVTLPSPSVSVDKGAFLVGAYPDHVFAEDKTEAGEDPTSGVLVADPSIRVKRAKKKKGDGVRPQTIHLTLKELFRIALASGNFKDDETAAKMQAASAHWLRHTMATRSVAGGVPVDVVQDLLGHANISTTSIYVQAERKRKMLAMQSFWNEDAANHQG
jgi:integrase